MVSTTIHIKRVSISPVPRPETIPDRLAIVQMRVHPRFRIKEPAADLRSRRLRVLALTGEVPRQPEGQAPFAHADNARGIRVVVLTLRINMPVAANIGQSVGPPRVWPPVGPRL